MDLKDEATNSTCLLEGKVVRRIYRHRPEEVCIEFTDGTRMFIDQKGKHLEISITESKNLT